MIPLALFLLACPNVSNADNISDAVNRYLSALTRGDTSALKTSVGGRLYQSRKILLEDNTEYSEFLKNFYQSSTFRIIDISPDTTTSNKVIATVEFEFPGGDTSKTKLTVAKDMAGQWKIVDETD